MNHFTFLIKKKNDRFNLTGKYTGSFLFCKIQVLNTSWFLYSLSIYAQKNTVHIWIHADGHMHILRENILWLQTWNQKMIASWQESDNKLRQCFEKQRHYSADEGLYSQGHRGLPSGHIWLWELDHKEGRMPKNWCLWTVMLEKTPESPLDSKEIKSVNLKGDQHWTLIGMTDAEAEVPVFWSFDANSWLTEKVPDAGKDWGQKKRVSEGKMAGCHHQCNERELGQTPREGEGQRGLVCCSPWGCRESDTIGQLNNRRENIILHHIMSLNMYTN